jgi:transcriptional activator of cad operon
VLKPLRRNPDEVWKDVVVTPNSVYHAVAELRRVFGDDPKEPTYIANVLRRSYRLVAPVASWVGPQIGASQSAILPLCKVGGGLNRCI